MSIFVRNSLLHVLLLFSFSFHASAATIESATTGIWSVPATWVGGVVPSATDDVVIKPTHTVTLSSSQACANLTVEGVLSVNSGGNLSQSGATSISGTLNILNTGLLDYSQVYSLSGTCSIAGGAQFIDGGFSGSGTLIVTGGSTSVTLNPGSVLNTHLSLSSTIFTDNSGLTPNTVTIQNATYSGTGSPTFASLAWNSSGTLAGSGTVTVTGSITGSASTCNMANSKELRVAGVANFTNGAGFYLSGTAKITVLNGGIFGNAFGTINGTSTNNIEVQAGGAFILSSGTSSLYCNFTLNGGTLTVGGTLNMYGTGTTHSFTNGTIIINGALTLGGAANSVVNSNNSVFSGNGTLSNGNGTVNYYSGNTIAVTGGFNVLGGIVIVGCSVTGVPPVAISGSGNLVDNVGLNFGAVSIQNATYSGTGSPTFASLTWSSGTLAGSGTVTVTGSITGSASTRNLADSKELRVAGTANFTNGAGFNLSGTAKITVLNGGVFGNAFGTINGTSTNNIEVQAGGTCMLSSGTSSMYCNFTLNGGTLTVGGTLNMFGTGTTHSFTNGTIIINGTLTLGSAINCVVNSNNSVFSGNGTLSTANGTVNYYSGNTISVTGGFNVLGGTVIVGCTVSGMPPVLISGSGNLVDNVGVNFGAVSIQNATYSGTGSPTFSSLAWNSGGTLAGSGTITVTGSITCNSSTRNIADSKVLLVAGAANFTGGASINVSGTAKITVPSGGVFGGSFGGISNSGSGSMEIQPGGTMSFSGTLCTIAVLFTNNGNTLVNSGVISIIQSNTHYGDFSVSAGATIRFTNTTSNTILAGTTLTNNGTLYVPNGRTIVLSGNAQQELTGNGTSIISLSLNNSAGLLISGSQTINIFSFINGLVQMMDGDVNISTLNGAASTRFFVTAGAGRLVMPVSTSVQIFPVGAVGGTYNPATLQQVSGSASFGVRVAPMNAYAPVNGGYVDRIWQIDLISGTANTNLTLSWLPDEETSGFDSQECTVARYDGSAWQGYTLGGAVCQDMCSRSAQNITAFSPFTVLSSIALPIEFVRFDGWVNNDGSASLRWQTALEVNNRGFFIEKSLDGNWFSSIGFVPSVSEHYSENSSYIFADKTFYSDAYFRLKQQDVNGTITYSSIIFLKKEGKNKRIIFNNPVAGQIHFSGEENTTDMSVELYHTNGQKAASFLIPAFSLNSAQIDLPDLPSGMYLLHISNGTIQQSEWIQVLER
ncbi:MAG: T9SS type A sorting domain-containing protein [Bacteroidetes bacterium]|nr:T9SS type A sorting domain-containing protein [Bacteroidota bacterium]